MTRVADLVLFSRNSDDIDYFTALARLAELDFHHVRAKDGLTRTLIALPGAVLAWDTGHPDSPAVKEVLAGLISPARVFGICDGHPADAKLFHSWIRRRYVPNAIEFFARLVTGACNPPKGLGAFFAKDVKAQKITIKGSDQKTAAVEATQSFLAKAGVDERLAALAAQATDELLMNAIFDAPCDKSGSALRRNIPRHSQFLFGPTERVTLEIARTDDLVGICVTDGFGSLNPVSVLQGFSRAGKKVVATPGHAPSGGIGLHGVSHSGLSLVLACEPRVRTDAMVFFPRASSFKAFRKSFQVTACLTAGHG